MNRRDFQQIARIRAGEARSLLSAGHYAGAYYLTGYVVECALKACIAKRVGRYDFPDRKLANESYTHNLKELLEGPARLKQLMQTAARADPFLAGNWTTVQRWSEQSRYEQRSQQEAEDLYNAAMDRQHGVFPWVRQYW